MVFDLHTTPQQGSSGRQHYWPRGEHGLPVVVLDVNLNTHSFPKTKLKCSVAVSLTALSNSCLTYSLFRSLHQRTGVSPLEIVSILLIGQWSSASIMVTRQTMTNGLVSEEMAQKLGRTRVSTSPPSYYLFDRLRWF
jgi:hypothetical protein